MSDVSPHGAVSSRESPWNSLAVSRQHRAVCTAQVAISAAVAHKPAMSKQGSNVSVYSVASLAFGLESHEPMAET